MAVQRAVSTARPSGSKALEWFRSTMASISFRPMPPTRVDRVGEIPVHHVLADADGLEDLGGTGRTGGWRCPSWRRSSRCRAGWRCCSRPSAAWKSLSSRPSSMSSHNGLLRQIGVDGAGAVAQQRGKVVHVPGLGGLQRIRDRAVRFLVRIRCCSMADTASRDGMATWFSSTPRSDRIDDVGPIAVGLVHRHRAAGPAPAPAGCSYSRAWRRSPPGSRAASWP